MRKDDSGPLDPRAAGPGDARRLRARARLLTAVAAAATVALGVVAKLAVPGLTGDLLGSALYTVLLALLLALVAPRLVAPRLAAPVAAGAATAASVGIELLQLTGLPAAAADAFPPAAWVLGSTFVATDLLGYLAGGVAGLVLLRVLRRAS
ncbi:MULTISPECIES: DUF2809 domain-containing protein [unclassified Frigoribacterium]|uniref:DUF2809 domain-containing protein n=1 Tax=unclassified Frigoribacterium TaxID=2627005 RepID=UPI00156442B2|nr:DUF2809 domain-containing protein [Frigoribacterium sp. VKM Ac-2860]NQX09797.1 DUF2809 domain-containing protein [Frigoribacterium sp. VKM Ac-2859]